MSEENEFQSPVFWSRKVLNRLDAECVLNKQAAENMPELAETISPIISAAMRQFAIFRVKEFAKRLMEES